MEQELGRALDQLRDAGEAPLYYLGYALTEVARTSISATLGTIEDDRVARDRYLDVDMRVGDTSFDNTRESRTLGATFWQEATRAPLDDDPLALRIALWRRTDEVFKEAQERYANLRTEAQMESRRQDASGDFSPAPPALMEEPLATLDLDLDAWRERVLGWSTLFRAHPDIHRSRIDLLLDTTDRYLVNSEGSRVATSTGSVRLVVYGWTKADDGMELYLYEIYDRSSPEGLPDDGRVRADIERMIANLKALRNAPVVDPYTGPAILQNRAASVFFHEIFGHRVEGHRQKSEEEGQTFTAKVGEQIMPEFLDVYDDPRLVHYAGEDLKGHYLVDDEGVRAQRVDLVDDGVLRGFLMSRSPIEGFPESNGHGRREHGYLPVSRQGNLVVESSRTRTYQALRTQLINLVREQGKPYGLIFTDISGGFTLTGRSLPQSFKVEPLLVYRVYPDGRPDELVRGVDLVGTPLTSLGKIADTGDDPAVFDGFCGAESGSIPVSAAAPSILISEMEIEKRAKSPTAPPVLEPPPLTASREGPVEAGAVDPVLLAMEDELGRCMTSLRLPASDGPYHLTFEMADRSTWHLRASFGARYMDIQDDERLLTTTVRVGDHSFDNTFFVGVQQGAWRPGVAFLPLGDDYGAVRHGIWMASDRAYKEALAHLTAKRAFARNTVQMNKPDDFSEAVPATSSDERAVPELDRQEWRERLRAVSGRFRDVGWLEEGEVLLRELRQTRRLVTSDGGAVRDGTADLELIISVAARADDGSRVSDYRVWRAVGPEDLPDASTMALEAESLIGEIRTLLDAEEGEPYVGPVLFLDQAAGEFFAQVMATQLANPREPLLEEDTFGRYFDESGAFADRLNRRILPTSFQVVDDPGLTTWDGTRLVGHYQVDAEGVRAERLNLVVDGWLRDLPMSRTPTRALESSNGHGRAGPGQVVQGKPGVLLISTEEPTGRDALHESLREQARLSQSPYAVLVTRLHVPWAQSMVDREGLVQQRVNDALLASPLLTFRVYADDGRMEPVRGYRFEEAGVRSLRDILAASGRQNLVQTVLDGSLGEGVPISVIAPDILLEEMVLSPIGGRRPLPPILNRPIPGG